MPPNQQEKRLHEAKVRGYEFADINIKGLFIAGFIMAVTVPLISLLVWVNLKFLAGSSYMGLTPPTIGVIWYEPTAKYPAPLLIRSSGEELYRLNAYENYVLTSYGWANPTTGVARVPIETAMELTLRRGLPVQQPGQTNVDGSEYDLIIQRRILHEQELKSGQAQAPASGKVGGTAK